MYFLIYNDFRKEGAYYPYLKNVYAYLKVPISFYSIQETHVREKTPRMTESNPSSDTRDVILDITLSSENVDKVRN